MCFFTVTPEDLRALARAKALTGEVLWTGFGLTPQEIEALQNFTRRVCARGPRCARRDVVLGPGVGQTFPAARYGTMRRAQLRGPVTSIPRSLISGRQRPSHQ